MDFMHDWYLVPGDSTEARRIYCENRILEQVEKTNTRDTLERLEDWLDRTRAKIHRLAGGQTLLSSSMRFRGNGIAYDSA